MDVIKSENQICSSSLENPYFDSISFQKLLAYFGILEHKSSYKIMCPVHQDINASLLINVEQANWFCFGCGTGGNSFDFFRFINGFGEPTLQMLFDYSRALKSKRIKNIQYNVYKSQESNYIDETEAIEQARHYFHSLPKTDWEHIPEASYLTSRGLQISTLNNCKAKLNYSDSYPYIFPLYDMGEFKGWVCRTDKKGIEKKRKYLYNEGFRRQYTLAGRYDNHTVMLVEGFIDYLKLRQFGAKYVAPILGWKISDEQIEKLKLRGVKNVISVLDNDEKGKEGTKYLERHFNVIPFEYPKGIKDPGEMTKEQFLISYKKTKMNHRRKKHGI